MLNAEMIGKTIRDITAQEMVGKDDSKTWISWEVITLHFTDGTSHSFVEDNADVYDSADTEEVNADEIAPGNVYSDEFGEWRVASDVQVLAAGMVSIDGDEYQPTDKIKRKRAE